MRRDRVPVVEAAVLRILRRDLDASTRAQLDGQATGVELNDHARLAVDETKRAVVPRGDHAIADGVIPPAEAHRRLRAVPGVGVWTAAEVAQRALGDADAVSVGDYHLSDVVGWSLLGGPLDDAGMVELLEPLRPHRYRAVRLIERTPGAGKPRFGPRMSIQDHRAH